MLLRQQDVISFQDCPGKSRMVGKYAAESIARDVGSIRGTNFKFCDQLG